MLTKPHAKAQFETTALQAYFRTLAGTDGCAPTRPNQMQIQLMRYKRAELRKQLGGGGRCYHLARFLYAEFGWKCADVTYLDSRGQVIMLHTINILPDGALLDATADQFGEGFDVEIIAQDDVRYRRYRMEWTGRHNPLCDAQCAAVLAELGQVWSGYPDGHLELRNTQQRGHGWWLVDKTALQEFWRQQLAYAEVAEDPEDDSYIETIKEILSDLDHVAQRSSYTPRF